MSAVERNKGKLRTIETLTEKVEDLEAIVDDCQYRNRG